MKRLVAIIYHESFSRRSYLTQGTRLQDFPDVLSDILKDERFHLLFAEPISEDRILRVHSHDHIVEVMRDPLCSTAWHSVGSVVLGAETILKGHHHRAFALIGAGGHHAGRNYFWGYCCFNDVVIAIDVIRSNYGIRRIAIVDTDAHHGDGTRELVRNDPDVLHCCICQQNYESPDGTNIDVSAYDRLRGARTEAERNAAYAAIVEEEFVPRIRSFSPEFIFWYFGFDTHRGDYGDLGLTVGAYEAIARSMCGVSDEVCNGRLEVVLGGGSSRQIANNVIPPIIRILGE
jgi:acetoin utilization deacetylase AcuC-like enzyme